MRNLQTVQIQTLMKAGNQIQEVAELLAELAGGEALELRKESASVLVTLTTSLKMIKERINAEASDRLEQKNAPAVERVKK